MGRMGSGGPQLHAVLPDDLQDIPSGIVICLRGEHRHQLRGLRHAVVVEVVVLRQYLCGLFQSGARQRSVLVHTHGAAVGVGLPCVPTPADRQQQGVHVRPCAPVLREKFVLRDGAAVRQGEVPADPAGGGDDLHLGPGPAAIGDSHQIICRRPPRRLPERPLVLPEKFTGLRVHDLQEFRHHVSADIHLTLSRCPDLELPVGGQGLSLHLGYRCGLQRRLVLRRLLPLCRHFGGRHPRCDRRDNCQCQHAKNPPFVHEKPPRKLFCKQFTGWFCLMSTTIQ